MEEAAPTLRQAEGIDGPACAGEFAPSQQVDRLVQALGMKALKRLHRARDLGSHPIKSLALRHREGA
jgi:hypothetical protein